jgi:nucleoside 2-deoxyribosyltransferase
MKAYLAIKFHENYKNRDLIEQISNSLEIAGFKSTIMVRDYEKWGKIQFAPIELMELTFKLIDEINLLVVEFSEKGTGLGIEAGYAYANNKPIIVIAQYSSEISLTLIGIAKEIHFYENPKEISHIFMNLKI